VRLAQAESVGYGFGPSRNRNCSQGSPKKLREIGWRSCRINCGKDGSKVLGDVAGIEPVPPPCLQFAKRVVELNPSRCSGRASHHESTTAIPLWLPQRCGLSRISRCGSNSVSKNLRRWLSFRVFQALHKRRPVEAFENAVEDGLGGEKTQTDRINLRILWLKFQIQGNCGDKNFD
jgi:hypothetical protein